MSLQEFARLVPSLVQIAAAQRVVLAASLGITSSTLFVSQLVTLLTMRIMPLVRVFPAI